MHVLDISLILRKLGSDLTLRTVCCGFWLRESKVNLLDYNYSQFKWIETTILK